MKKIHLIFVEEQNGKFFASPEAIRIGVNLKNYIDRVPNVKTIHICESATQAHSLAAEWNEVYKANGTYLFD